VRTYKKKGYHTPAALAARRKGAAVMHSRKFIHDKTSVSVDKAVKYAAVEAFGNIHNALVFAVEHKGCNTHGTGEKTDEQ
jgi:hypothetical protein